jgi:hypothetical protein
MWRGIRKTLVQRQIKTAFSCAAVCCVVQMSGAEPLVPSCGPASLAIANTTGFAVQVSLRDKNSKAKPAEGFLSERPKLEYRLSTTLDNNIAAPGTALPIASQFSTLRLRAPQPETPLPHLLSWMEGWRMDIERGLFRPLRDHAFRLAVAYNDIFERRGHPDKGGHGPGLVLRYDFRRPSAL